MKNLIFLISTALFVLSLYSCKKKAAVNHGNLSATVSGNSFVSTSIAELGFSVGNTVSYSYSAAASDSDELILSLDSLQPGTYYFSAQVNGTSIEYLVRHKEYYSLSTINTASPGSITVTSYNANGISGTFSGTLYNESYASGSEVINTSDSVVITNGIFTNMK